MRTRAYVYVWSPRLGIPYQHTSASTSQLSSLLLLFLFLLFLLFLLLALIPVHINFEALEI